MCCCHPNPNPCAYYLRVCGWAWWVANSKQATCRQVGVQHPPPHRTRRSSTLHRSDPCVQSSRGPVCGPSGPLASRWPFRHSERPETGPRGPGVARTNPQTVRAFSKSESPLGPPTRRAMQMERSARHCGNPGVHTCTQTPASLCTCTRTHAHTRTRTRTHTHTHTHTGLRMNTRTHRHTGARGRSSGCC